MPTDNVKQTLQQYLLFILSYVDSATGWSWDSRYDPYIGSAYIGPADPLTAQVVLFLKGDGINNSTSIIDSSPNPKTMTANGNAKISTALSKYGGSSLLFDGTTNCYVSTLSTFALNKTTQNFTEEAWVYMTGYANNNNGYYHSTIAAKDSVGSREFSFAIVGTASSYTGLNFTGFYGSNGSSNYVVTGNFNFALNTFYHVAASRQNGTLRLFVNGTKIAEEAFNYSLNASNVSHKIGANLYDNYYPYYFKGHIDSYRLTIGTGRYIDNFDPETIYLA